jgi:hypothetical protein
MWRAVPTAVETVPSVPPDFGWPIALATGRPATLAPMGAIAYVLVATDYEPVGSGHCCNQP